MSKSDNGAIVGQIIKGAIALIGTAFVAVFSAKKGKEKYHNWNNNKKS